MAGEGRQVLVQGRIVWLCGNTPFTGSQRKDQNGRLLTDDKGQPLMQYGYGLAVKKPDAPDATPGDIQNFMTLWEAVQGEAMALYPTGQVPPGFSYKFKDGDGIDHQGQSFAKREGYKNHYVFAMTTSLPLKYFKYEGAYQLVSEGIKCGDYVQVQVNVKGHTPKPGTQGKPGLYLNPNMTLFIGYGNEIVNAPDASSVFGATPPPVPNGASATPIGGAPNFANFGQQQQVPQMGQPPVQQQAPAQWNGQSNPAVLPPQFQGNGMSAQPPQQFAPPTQQFQPTVPQQQQNFGQPPVQQMQSSQPQWGQPPVQQQAPAQFGNPVNTQANPSVPSNGIPTWNQR